MTKGLAGSSRLTLVRAGCTSAGTGEDGRAGGARQSGSTARLATASTGRARHTAVAAAERTTGSERTPEALVVLEAYEPVFRTLEPLEPLEPLVAVVALAALEAEFRAEVVVSWLEIPLEVLERSKDEDPAPIDEAETLLGRAPELSETPYLDAPLDALDAPLAEMLPSEPVKVVAGKPVKPVELAWPEVTGTEM
ncbi:hypothetical protein KL925_003962 [Ogataea polymorpha]|nr:hypothetical protein KL925_003962 [Ogataea polymorpha]KAG7932702.1 hypothetical protein KL934_003357 [Ogataea polymorpha]